MLQKKIKEITSNSQPVAFADNSTTSITILSNVCPQFRSVEDMGVWSRGGGVGVVGVALIFFLFHFCFESAE